MSSTINASVDGIVLTASSTAAMNLATGGTNRLSIDTSGNVGIATGNLSFSATGQRITGDFSNATVANRLLFQSSTTNGGTEVGVMPNGTGAVAGWNVYGTPTTAATTVARFDIPNNTETRLLSGRTDASVSFIPMTFYTGGSERMRLDTSGNLGIGNTAPSYKLQVNNASASATADAITVQNSGVTTTGHATGIRFRYITAEPAAIRAVLTNDQTGTGTLSFFTSSDGTGANLTERMRITSGGLVGIGTASPNVGLEVASIASENSRSLRVAYDTTYYYEIRNLGAAGNRIRSNNGSMTFNITGTDYAALTTGGEFITGGTTDQGAYNLQCNGTGVWGAGAYVNGSDARLKDNIQSLDSGLDVVKAMRPVTFQYKPEYSKDQSVQPGFIAQELQTAMAGKSYLEGVVQEGTNHLNVAYQNIIPILVKAIQELEAKVAALESK